MGAIKGQNLRVFIGAKAVALATNCTLNVNVNTEDGSTKDTTGAGVLNVANGASWDISFESLYTNSDNAAQTFATLKTLAIGMTSATVLFDKADGTNNRSPESADYALTGTAYVSQLTLKADNRQNVTISGTLTGSGELNQLSTT